MGDRLDPSFRRTGESSLLINPTIRGIARVSEQLASRRRLGPASLWAASAIVADMHLRKLESRELGDRDKEANAAREELINAMKRQLGESEDQQEDSRAAGPDASHASPRR
ncbi:MAG TPA: hypothetical protein VE441_13230 [Mycobacterium sp.]|jgi:hypothetical protein|nr:hypothetical protein [Mycobacterium sp.]